MDRVRGVICLLPLLVAACDVGEDEPNPEEGDGGSHVDGGAGHPGSSGGRSGASGGRAGDESDGDGIEGCLASSTALEIATQDVEKIDLLFVVDNSGSMREEQAALREQFPRLISALVSGDRDGDGTQDFPAAADLHLGVVSTDMGAVSVNGLPGCEGHGDDGVMQNTPSANVPGCQASYPRFLSYTAAINDEQQTAVDFACIAELGTDGCGFQQPLEAGLKALWPSVDFDPATGLVTEPNRIVFLGDQNGFGQLGHGDTLNAGFLRNDPASGLSAIAIVVVTDADDCSSKNTEHFVPPDQLSPSSPLAQQALNLRCFFNPQNLYPLERYINGLRALRPHNENLVLFSAIVGVPADLVEPEDQDGVDWPNDAERDAYYDRILNDARMQEVIDSSLPAADMALVPSCESERGRAHPPRRIVQVARGFGANGSVQSICNQDFAPAIDRIVERIAPQLGAPCLSRPLVRGSDGLTACDVVWELPPPGNAPASTPVSCADPGFDFLSEPSSGSALGDRGGARCVVRQLAVENDEVQPAGGAVTGWYYDDFSEEAAQCTGGQPQRIAFTPEAKAPDGVSVRLECAIEQGESCGDKPPAAEESRVGDPCLPDILPASGFDESEVYVSTPSGDCGGGSCLVYHLGGDATPGCTPLPSESDGPRCVHPEDLHSRVYCSCRCDAPEGFAECDCPDGFSCVDAIARGSEGVRGGYCVRNGTFTQ